MPNDLCRDAAASLLLTTSYLHAWYPPRTFSSISRLTQLLVRAGFYPAFLNLHIEMGAHIKADVCQPHSSDHGPTSCWWMLVWLRSTLFSLRAGVGAGRRPWFWCWWGCFPALLLVLLRLRWGPKTHIFPMLQGSPFLEHTQSRGPRGKERWCNGVQATDRKSCALVQRKLIPSQGKSWKTTVVLKEKHMWPRRIQNMSCTPWYPRCSERCVCQKLRRAQDQRVRAWYWSAF